MRLRAQTPLRALEATLHLGQAVLAGLLGWSLAFHSAANGVLSSALAGLRTLTPLTPHVFGAGELDPAFLAQMTNPPLYLGPAFAVMLSLVIVLRSPMAGSAMFRAAVLGCMFLALAHADRLARDIDTSATFAPPFAEDIAVALFMVGLALSAVAVRTGQHRWVHWRRMASQAVAGAAGATALWMTVALVPWLISLFNVSVASLSTYAAPALLLGALIRTVASRDRAEREAVQAATATALSAVGAQRDAARLERELEELRLQATRSQVEPHFLWNTLANLDHLIRTGQDAAHQMARDMQQYLRHAQPQARGQASTLGEECDAIRAYLSLLQIRMGERLGYEIIIHDPDRGLQFPPLVLHTLVENAVQHGIDPSGRPGRVRIEVARTETDRVRVQVRDDGVGLQTSAATRGTGIGLRSVRAALRECFGDAAGLSLVSETQGGTCATVVVPAVSK